MATNIICLNHGLGKFTIVVLGQGRYIFKEISLDKCLCCCLIVFSSQGCSASRTWSSKPFCKFSHAPIVAVVEQMWTLSHIWGSCTHKHLTVPWSPTWSLSIIWWYDSLTWSRTLRIFPGNSNMLEVRKIVALLQQYQGITQECIKNDIQACQGLEDENLFFCWLSFFTRHTLLISRPCKFFIPCKPSTIACNHCQLHFRQQPPKVATYLYCYNLGGFPKLYFPAHLPELYVLTH